MAMPYSTLDKQVHTYTGGRGGSGWGDTDCLKGIVPTIRVEEMAQAESPLLHNFPVSHDPGKDHKAPG